MIGAINKLLRKAAAFKGKTEFENRLIKATYQGDLKEAKDKHVAFILEVLKGQYHEMVRPPDAMEKILDTLFSNLKSISVINKVLSILHRSLQEEMISQMIAVKIKEKENMLISCVRDSDHEHSDDIRMQIQVSDLYIEYIKTLVNFVCVCQLFSISLRDLMHYSQGLKVQELFQIFCKIDQLIETIFKMFEERNFCKRYRIFQNIIFLLFIDLGKIYQCYYLLITTMLGHIDEMDVTDCKRSYLAYSNFVRINKEVRQMAACVIGMFDHQQQETVKINFYDVDPGMFDILMEIINEKSRKEGQTQKLKEQKLELSVVGKKMTKKHNLDLSQQEFSLVGKHFRRNSSSRSSLLDVDQVLDDSPLAPSPKEGRRRARDASPPKKMRSLRVKTQATRSPERNHAKGSQPSQINYDNQYTTLRKLDHNSNDKIQPKQTEFGAKLPKAPFSPSKQVPQDMSKSRMQSFHSFVDISQNKSARRCSLRQLQEQTQYFDATQGEEARSNNDHEYFTAHALNMPGAQATSCFYSANSKDAGSPHQQENYETAQQNPLPPASPTKGNNRESKTSQDFSDHVIGQVRKLQSIGIQKRRGLSSTSRNNSRLTPRSLKEDLYNYSFQSLEDLQEQASFANQNKRRSSPNLQRIDHRKDSASSLSDHE